MIQLTIVAGARPNFMKIAPLIHQIQKKQQEGKAISFRLVHTGQHYDKNLSDTFFEELNIPKPDANLMVGGGTQAEQTAGIMIGFEKELADHPSDLVIVVGDVTSTMACSIVAKKANVKVAHIEAGIRSFDLTMPEEINRMVTDSITDYFFTTSSYANENLKKAGIEDDRIFFVGNIMIDSLVKNLERIEKPSFFDALDSSEKKYLVLTMHRPANVDNKENLERYLDNITTFAKDFTIVFPIHPRTKPIVEAIGKNYPNLEIVEPQPYLKFIYLLKNAAGVITDSGGITEEATYLHIPCITLRENTERPETCVLGSNVLVGNDFNALEENIMKIAHNNWKNVQIPELWDGNTANRIVEILLDLPL
ncbi:non-hydrolyzing UDP-N-acetylglucosamine 2-epimerase [Flavobacterium saliperosum]|uniref:UDP-N-acetylglucosamine 2-epimerase (Non-hydrolysing) n=2 Tax=Flavobacterium saliperosum TaxID=329186 RepID=A0A1G4W3E2_9FLAO|nr:UDP-N-acetylglucosamine 2-epimerase (non-hydrolyzing) [Flavobacterium saliperosum]SCX16118.1 UDP-N-acetylglucosamine 2-epimerase (non-hydrolysing) [Flavobacterium saliperosum]